TLIDCRVAAGAVAGRRNAKVVTRAPRRKDCRARCKSRLVCCMTSSRLGLNEFCQTMQQRGCQTTGQKASFLRRGCTRRRNFGRRCKKRPEKPRSSGRPGAALAGAVGNRPATRLRGGKGRRQAPRKRRRVPS